jgi:hypothetical protein
MQSVQNLLEKIQHAKPSEHVAQKCASAWDNDMLKTRAAEAAPV